MTAEHTVEDEFPLEVVRVLGRRREAFRERGVRVKTHANEFDESQAEIVIAFAVDGGQVLLRVYVRADRWVSVDARRASEAGWDWRYAAQGRFVSQDPPVGLIALIERTMDESAGPTDTRAAEVAALWAPHLATGPRVV